MAGHIMPGAEPFTYDGAPKGDTGCLLVHGWTASPQEMRGLGRYLADRGCGVVGVRLAGHGTTPAEMQRTRWPEWVASARQGLAQLRATRQRVFLVGLSMGGVIALYLAQSEPVGGVVALAAPARLTRRWMRFAQPWLKYVVPYIKKATPPTGWFDPDAARRRVAYHVYPTHAVGELVGVMKATQRGLGKVTVPTLFIYSRDDRTVRPDAAQRYYRGVASVDKELIFIEGSGHILTEDARRDDVARRVWEWIRQHSSAEAP